MYTVDRVEKLYSIAKINLRALNTLFTMYQPTYVNTVIIISSIKIKLAAEICMIMIYYDHPIDLFNHNHMYTALLIKFVSNKFQLVSSDHK